jgi:lysophospholipase L1-like esterase
VDLVLWLLWGPVRLVEDFYEPHPHYGYRMRPQIEFVFASPYHGYHANVRTNSRGLRDDEYSVPKGRGQFRVLLLGDSMTAGLEVDKRQTFEAVCEERLADSGVEVINAGVRGYNLDNIVAFLEQEGLSYAPDVIVYVFVDNDLTGDTGFNPRAGDVSRGFTLGGLVGRIARHSHITYRLELVRQMVQMRWERDRRENGGTKSRVPGGLYQMFRSADYAAPHYQLTAQRICRLRALSDTIGAQLLVVGAPHREEIDPESQQWWQRIVGAGAALDFDGVRRYLDWVAQECACARLDPVPMFRERLPAVGSFWFHKDNHLNAKGHRLLGELLSERLRATTAFQEWNARVGPGMSNDGGVMSSPGPPRRNRVAGLGGGV